MMPPAPVALIDYGSGNLHSAGKALERAAREGGTNKTVLVTADPDVVRRADRIVLPGVGAYADCRRELDAVPGMVEALTEAVLERGAPLPRHLRRSAAAGLARARTWRDRGPRLDRGRCGEDHPSDPALKIPHMGWNSLNLVRPHPLFEGIATGADGLDAYYVHSYHLKAANPAEVIATSDYGSTITAVVGRDNIAGTQFHPEKSQRLGLALANFLKWTP